MGAYMLDLTFTFLVNNTEIIVSTGPSKSTSEDPDRRLIA